MRCLRGADRYGDAFEFLTAMFGAKIKRLAVALRTQSCAGVHLHPTDWIGLHNVDCCSLHISANAGAANSLHTVSPSIQVVQWPISKRLFRNERCVDSMCPKARSASPTNRTSFPLAATGLQRHKPGFVEYTGSVWPGRFLRKAGSIVRP